MRGALNRNEAMDDSRRRRIVKNACWVLLALGVLAFVCSVVARLLPAHQLFGSLPVSWWRLAMVLAVFAIALKVVDAKE